MPIFRLFSKSLVLVFFFFRTKRTRVLLSHIPLWAPAREDGICNERKRGRRSDFRLGIGRGISYQNVLDRDLTDLMLKKLKPSIVLSGDGEKGKKK